MTKFDVSPLYGPFFDRFGGEPESIVKSPGRVNLIGEHTDYNGGFVLPLAIDRSVQIAARARTDRKVVLRSLDFDSEVTFDLDRLEKGPADWIEYPKGVAWALEKNSFKTVGWEGVVTGNVPQGAGLSSSAAFELAVAGVFAVVGSIDWDPTQMAQIGQEAENGWVGMRCGIMDQLISAAGVADCAVLIDCQSLKLEPVRLPSGTAVTILDTSTRRGLVDSAYNSRRAQCEEAAKFFGVQTLREIEIDQFERDAYKLDPITRQRAGYVIRENGRTLAAASAMRDDDPVRLGELLCQSHEGLRDEFEVSSPALDAMAEIATEHDRCYGARMTGAGFGGCAVALIEAEAAEQFSLDVAAEYKKKTGHIASIYITRAMAGTSWTRNFKTKK